MLVISLLILPYFRHAISLVIVCLRHFAAIVCCLRYFRRALIIDATTILRCQLMLIFADAAIAADYAAMLFADAMFFASTAADALCMLIIAAADDITPLSLMAAAELRCRRFHAADFRHCDYFRLYFLLP